MANREPAGSGRAACILAGGRSTRMGRDKAFLPIGGRPAIERLIERFGAAFPELFLSIRDPKPFRHLGVPLVVDPLPDGGPLAGLVACLEAARAPVVLAVAVDLPLAPPAFGVKLAAEVIRRDVEALLPRAGGRLHPLFAAYARAAGPKLSARLAAGERSVVRAAATLRHAVVGADFFAVDEPTLLRAFTNVNTPEDYAAVRTVWEIGDLP
ncbi:MAG: molybdenum cofactor guanylyltransferase [Hydrogenibacillus schlegelii]|uniref:Probable molybdenum cofactor guanylyltransferase n=1 Tax=Hydrogenibacillus schlegelii TaxID=1484 RepID=A0A947CXW6_HYDSH|nr:molybdenum cofactor guanylyltransferase [Hydrogenibacillus schlegelii]